MKCIFQNTQSCITAHVCYECRYKTLKENSVLGFGTFPTTTFWFQLYFLFLLLDSFLSTKMQWYLCNCSVIREVLMCINHDKSMGTTHRIWSELSNAYWCRTRDKSDKYKVLSSSVYALKNCVCALILLNFNRCSVYFCILQERIEVYFERCDVWRQCCLNISIFVSFEISGIHK